MKRLGRRLPAAAVIAALAVAAGLAGGCYDKVEAKNMDASGDRSDTSSIAGKGAGARETATFGAGCFWGVEAAFRNVEGVTGTTVGYSGGHFDNPTYEDVCSGRTGHAEVVQVEFDPGKVSYERLLEVFWDSHDPTTLDRQGPDIGEQYRSVIFYHTPEQEKAARASAEALEQSDRYTRPIVTAIEPFEKFWKAEEYHQQYLEKRGLASCHISLK